MSDTEKNAFDDVEKGDAFGGPIAVDVGTYSGVPDAAAPSDGVYAKFDHYNRKLERKLGIETVSRAVFG